MKTKINTKFLQSNYDDKTAPEIEPIIQRTLTFIQNVPSHFTVETGGGGGKSRGEGRSEIIWGSWRKGRVAEML